MTWIKMSCTSAWIIPTEKKIAKQKWTTQMLNTEILHYTYWIVAISFSRKSERKTKFLRSTYTFSELLMTAMIWIRYVWAHLSEWASKHVSFHTSLTLCLYLSPYLLPTLSSFIHSLSLSPHTQQCTKFTIFYLDGKLFIWFFEPQNFEIVCIRENHCT